MRADIWGPIGSAITAACCLGLAPVVSALAAAGLGFLIKDVILIPLLVLFLGATLWQLHRDRRRHRAVGPVATGWAGAVLTLVGLWLHAMVTGGRAGAARRRFVLEPGARLPATKGSYRPWRWGSMKMRNVSISFLLLASTGCATLVNGTSQEIRMTTEPPGAAVLLRCPDGDRSLSEVTPVAIRLSRRGPACSVVLSKAGYQPVTVGLVKKMSPWSLGNVVTCGCGLAVDAMTGGMFAFVPGSVEVTLEPSVEPPQLPDDSNPTDREVDR